MWRVGSLLVVVLGLAGCSSDPETTPRPDDTEDPCGQKALGAATATTRHYIAMNEPGADNDACDGLAPTDEGNGHCPWKDFTSPNTLHALDQVKSVRVDVRDGTYRVEGWEGIRVAGMGTSESERVILSAYPGESPILDVPRPDGVGCTEATAESDPKCVREVVRVSGDFTLVQGFTIRNGLGFHLELTGADDATIRCNHFVETVDFSMRSDQLKVDAGSTRVEISHNEFEAFRSQAIDMAPGYDVLIEKNRFHDPLEANSGIVGMKLGTSGVIIRDNDIHDLGSDFVNNQAFSMGGTGSVTVDEDGFTAHDLHVIGNRLSNTHGVLAQLIACQDCSVENNDVVNAGAGVFVRAQALGDVAQCAGGCKPSANPHITGNRFRQMIGNGEAGTEDSFIGAEAGEGTGIVAGGNLYCASVVSGAGFGWEGLIVEFDEWKTSSGTDADSVLVQDSDPRCQGW